MYVHIGMHKTGTTSIQVFLYEIRQALKTHGIVYPETACPPEAVFGQHMIAWAFMTNPDYVPQFVKETMEATGGVERGLGKDMKDEIAASGMKRIILSSEELDCLTTEEIERFAACFSEYRLKPVVFLRNTADFLEACFKTNVVHYDELRIIDVYANNQRSRIDTYQFISDWAKLSHDGKVSVVDYDTLMRNKEDSVRAFLNAAGLQELLTYYREPINANLSVESYKSEMVRFLRSCGCSQEHILQWLELAEKLPTHNQPHKEGFFTAEKHKYWQHVYAEEIQKLKKAGHIDWTFTPSLDDENYASVGNIVDAIFAMTRRCVVQE